MSNPADVLATDQAALWVPKLELIAEALGDGLATQYRNVKVTVEDCPDLRELGCAWAGLGGDPCIVDVGGEPYAHNPRYRDVRFAIRDLQRCAGRDDGRILGAGMATPAAIAGHCGEVIANIDTVGADGSRVARVGPQQECIVEPYEAALFSGLANLFISRGEPGPVLAVDVSVRTGDQASLPQAIRSALSKLVEPGSHRQIALGGVFRVDRGQIRSHVMPDYDCIGHEYYDTGKEEVVRDFLQFYEPVGPNLTCFSVLWTGDPTGTALDLRPSGEHTHFYNPDDPHEGGHYHFDVTPDEIHCRGYFAPAQTVYRIGNIYRELRKGGVGPA